MILIKDSAWGVLLAAICMQLGIGSVYAWSIFIKPLTALGISPNWSIANFSVAIFFLGLTAALAGVKMAKDGPGYMSIYGGILFSLAHALAALAIYLKLTWLLVLGYGVVGGIGLGLCYVVPVSTVAAWFPNHKGAATGAVIMGFGFGAMIMSKVVAPWFLYITNNDLQKVFLYIALLLLCILPAMGALLKLPPQATHQPTDKTDSTLFADLKSRTFVIIWLVAVCNIAAGLLIISSQAPLYEDLLTSQNMLYAGAGGTLVAITSIFNGIGRLFWGKLSDNIGTKKTFQILLFGEVIAVLLFLIYSTPILFFIIACYLVFCYGGGFGTFPATIIESFPSKKLAPRYGALLTAWGVGGLMGPSLLPLSKIIFPNAGLAGSLQLALGFLCVAFGASFFLKRGEKTF